MVWEIKKIYNKNFLLAELGISIILIIILISIFHFIWTSSNIESWVISRSNDFYPLIATISGTLFGFVITGVAILLAFPNSEKLDRLRKSKHYKTVYKVYFSAIKYLAITLVISIIGLLLKEDFVLVIFYLLLWSIIISSLRIWRCVWILKNIINIM